MLVRMELSRIIIQEMSDRHYIYLREVDGQREFPIVIGIFEASSIDRRVKDEPRHRPFTHDLLKNTIDQLGGEAEDIVITKLEDHTYFATIRVRQNGEMVEIDSRPSDAIALSVHYSPVLPIFVEDDVLDQVT